MPKSISAFPWPRPTTSTKSHVNGEDSLMTLVGVCSGHFSTTKVRWQTGGSIYAWFLIIEFSRAAMPIPTRVRAYADQRDHQFPVSPSPAISPPSSHAESSLHNLKTPSKSSHGSRGGRGWYFYCPLQPCRYETPIIYSGPKRHYSGMKGRTTISSLLSSKGSDSWPSLLSLSPLINVPFELFISFI